MISKANVAFIANFSSLIQFLTNFLVVINRFAIGLVDVWNDHKLLSIFLCIIHSLLPGITLNHVQAVVTASDIHPEVFHIRAELCEIKSEDLAIVIAISFKLFVSKASYFLKHAFWILADGVAQRVELKS